MRIADDGRRPGSVRVNSSQPADWSIVVRLGASLAQEPLDGRLLLLLSKDGTREPRFQVSATSLSSAQVFGIDVEGLKAGDERTFDAAVLGYPLESLAELPAGEYTVQALLHKYETFRLATGPHRQAADGPRRRPAVEQRARQPL